MVGNRLAGETSTSEPPPNPTIPRQRWGLGAVVVGYEHRLFPLRKKLPTTREIIAFIELYYNYGVGGLGEEGG